MILGEAEGERPELFDLPKAESVGAKLHCVSGRPKQAVEASK